MRQTQTLVTALDVLLHAPGILLLRQRTPLEAVLRVARMFLEASSSVWGNIEWLFAWRHRYRRIIMRWECHAANGWAPRSLTRRTLGSSLPSDPDASHPADTGNMLDRHGHRVVFCTIALPTGSVFMVRSGR